MGWWQVNADTLANSRFVVSPLAEATASMRALDWGTAGHPGEQAWLDAHRPAYRQRLADDPSTALLLRTAMGRRWNADFTTPAPTGEREPTFEQELAQIRRTSDETVRADLVLSSDGPVPPELLRLPDLAARLADLVTWVWEEAVWPYWTRRRRIIEADVIARTEQLSRGGWAGALDDLRPGMRWLGEGRLQINVHDYPPREVSGARLMFVPVTPRQGWVAWHEHDRYAVVYPCSGVLADVERTSVPEALGALLGPARAGVLVLLDTPKSTTQLVALTGQGLGSVGRHLKVLLDAHLVWRRRSGRSVLYSRTTTADDLVNASVHPTSRPERP
jgi:DNA-binding transcriptional ArsR family regulator